MLEEHHIEWIYLQTEDGGQRKWPEGRGAPEATFALGGSKPIAAYAYCNRATASGRPTHNLPRLTRKKRSPLNGTGAL
jgi:hypothetical protein